MINMIQTKSSVNSNPSSNSLIDDDPSVKIQEMFFMENCTENVLKVSLFLDCLFRYILILFDNFLTISEVTVSHQLSDEAFNAIQYYIKITLQVIFEYDETMKNMAANRKEILEHHFGKKNKKRKHDVSFSLKIFKCEFA